MVCYGDFVGVFVTLFLIIRHCAFAYLKNLFYYVKTALHAQQCTVANLFVLLFSNFYYYYYSFFFWGGGGGL
jgi:hypothetical protein